jgi:hypothetical protein
MYFSTARGRTFSRFVNPASKAFSDFIKGLKGKHVFAKNEDPYQP